MTRKDFTTIVSEKICETVIKGSRFIGIATPVSTEEDLRARLSDIAVRFPKATHYCYGAVYGGSSLIERSSDNGEPSGTAGRPILTVVRESGLSDVAVVVVRYFGGTLLGTGGLVRAYSESASAALELCEKMDRTMCDVFTVKVPYAMYDRFMSRLERFFKGRPECAYAADVDVTVSVPRDLSDDFLKALSEATDGHLSAALLTTGYR